MIQGVYAILQMRVSEKKRCVGGQEVERIDGERHVKRMLKRVSKKKSQMPQKGMTKTSSVVYYALRDSMHSAKPCVENFAFA